MSVTHYVWLREDLGNFHRFSEVKLKAELKLVVSDEMDYCTNPHSGHYSENLGGLVVHPEGKEYLQFLISKELVQEEDPDLICPLCENRLGTEDEILMFQNKPSHSYCTKKLKEFLKNSNSEEETEAARLKVKEYININTD